MTWGHLVHVAGGCASHKAIAGKERTAAKHELYSMAIFFETRIVYTDLPPHT